MGVDRQNVLRDGETVFYGVERQSVLRGWRHRLMLFKLAEAELYEELDDVLRLTPNGGKLYVRRDLVMLRERLPM